MVGPPGFPWGSSSVGSGTLAANRVPAGTRRVGGVGGEREHDGCSRRLRGDQSDAELVEQHELQLVGNLFEPVGDGCEIATENLGDRDVGPGRSGRPLGHVAEMAVVDRGDEGVLVAAGAHRTGRRAHRGVPSSR